VGSSTVDTLKWLMAAPTHTEFSQRCWRVHDNVHVWVGGEMSDPNWAAFDPLFWAHHAMVDRLWRIWQQGNQGADPGPDLIDRPMTFLKSPSFTVREVLDVTKLGYDYAGQASAPVGGPS
jgi:tyrosinase